MISDNLKAKITKYRELIMRFLICLLFISLFFYFCHSLNSSFGYITEKYKTHEVLPLNPGEEVTQYMDHNSGVLKGFSLIFGTYLRANEGDVIVSFKEDDKVICQWKFKADEPGDDVYKEFNFDRPIRLNGTSRYAISVQEFFSGENFLSVYMTAGGKSLYCADTGLRDNYTLCYRLRFLEKEKNTYKYILAAMCFILLSLLLVLSVRKPDFSSKKSFCLLTILLLSGILLFSADYEISEKVNKNIEVSKYAKNCTAKIISPQNAEVFVFDADQDSFNSLEFYILNEYNGEISMSLLGPDGQTYFDNYVIPEEYYIPAVDKGNRAVKIDMLQTGAKEGRLPIGQYTITLGNLDSAEELAVNVNGKATEKLNVVLKRKSMFGEVILFTVLLSLICYIFIIFTLAENDRLNIEGFYLISAVLLIAVNLALVQPWNIPDSKVHFAATYRLSNLLLGHWGESAWQGRACDVGFIHSFWRDCIPDMSGVLHVIHNLQIFASDKTMMNLPKATHMEYYSALNYLPQILGITVGRILGFGAVLTVYLGRLSIAAAYIGLCYHAIKTTPVGKSIFAIIALLPSSVMLGASFSYDAMAIIASLNFMACILRLCKESSRKILIESMVWAFFLGGIKAGGFLILLPLVLLLYRKEDRGSIKRIVMILGAGVLSVVLFDLIIPAGSRLFQFGKEGTGKMTASYAFTNPVKYLQMTVGAYIKYADGLIREMSGSQVSWGNMAVPVTVTFGILAVGIICFVIEKDSLEFRAKDKYLMGFVVMLSIIFTPMMLLSWTPNGSEVIEGLQGRYYLPVFPLVFLILTKFKLHKNIQINSSEGERAIQGKCFKYLCVLFTISVYYTIRLCLTQ